MSTDLDNGMMAAAPAAAVSRSAPSAPDIRVVSAAAASAADRHAITVRGIPSRALMQRAGAAAAGAILRRYGDRLQAGVAVLCGGGNNGGDGWVVAGALVAAGLRVRVDEVVPASTPDCIAERELVRVMVRQSAADGGEAVVVDAMLGTGGSGPPRAAIALGLKRLAALNGRGAVVVALDVPSALDATTGDAEHAVGADLTITFGTLKRGLLVARAKAGAIVVVDIGLGESVGDAPRLASRALLERIAPPFPSDAHKGVRKKLAIVGGGEGMVGAAVLAGRAAMRAGIGMTRLFVAPASLSAAQTALPEAMSSPWPESDDAVADGICEWADGLVLGPGLGNTPATRAVVERLLRIWRGPVLLDADALNIFAGDPDRLAGLLGQRPAAITPHPAEFARLAGGSPTDALAGRFDRPTELAARLGATVLFKGVPTVIAGPRGEAYLSARGTPALAAAGSGDVLAGIAGTLLAQAPDDVPATLAAAAWLHGRAAELASAGRPARGVVLDDILDAVALVWGEPVEPASYPELAELPASGTPHDMPGGS